MEKTLGILGGMGPLATSYFYQMIINKTDAKTDQEHINMIILNDVLIPDRTSFILGNGENPLPRLINDLRKLEGLDVDLIAVPCNTCTYFYEEMQKSTNIEILNMIRDTCLYLKENNINNTLILATSGTIKSNLYQKYLERFGIDYKVTSYIDEIMFLIYERVKKGITITEKELSILFKEIDKFDSVILGCTELSILKCLYGLDDRFIDPLEVECDLILKKFNKKKR